MPKKIEEGEQKSNQDCSRSALVEEGSAATGMHRGEPGASGGTRWADGRWPSVPAAHILWRKPEPPAPRAS
jgi:hypothetical protein